MQLPRLTISACRSEPPSIGVRASNGYRTRSLSLAYPNLTLTPGWWRPTTANGRPYLGGPKSGCRSVEFASAECSQVSLISWTGSPSTRVFQMFDVGKTPQSVPRTDAASADGGASTSAAETNAPIAAIRMPTMLKASASRCEHLDGQPAERAAG